MSACVHVEICCVWAYAIICILLIALKYFYCEVHSHRPSPLRHSHSFPNKLKSLTAASQSSFALCTKNDKHLRSNSEMSERLDQYPGMIWPCLDDTGILLQCCGWLGMDLSRIIPSFCSSSTGCVLLQSSWVSCRCLSSLSGATWLRAPS